MQRFNGLGETNPDQLYDTTTDPEHRTLQQVRIADASIADRTFAMAMARAVGPVRQLIEMRYPLGDGQGNFGSIANDPAPAMRHTEALLARLATEMLRDLAMDTVEFGWNYDDSRLEPLVLRSRFPNRLVNGAAGTAV